MKKDMTQAIHNKTVILNLKNNCEKLMEEWAPQDFSIEKYQKAKRAKVSFQPQLSFIV